MNGHAVLAWQAVEHGFGHQGHAGTGDHAGEHALIRLDLNGTAHRHVLVGKPRLQTSAIGTTASEGEHCTAGNILGAEYWRVVGFANQHQLFVAQGHTVQGRDSQRAVDQRRVETPR